MAVLNGTYSDKLMQDEDELNQQGQNQFGGADTQPAQAGTSGVVSGSNTAPATANTSGVGPGGMSGWTNIQAYLGANKGDTGSAKLLQDKAGGIYDNESKLLGESSDKAKSDAMSQANKINEVKDNSKNWINQSAQNYNYTGNQNSAYSDNVNKIKSGLYDQYSGPENYAYGKSSDFQRYNSAFGDNDSFNNLINDLQKEKAGGQMTSGQGALQTQLDVNNQNLADARQNLLKQYAGFDDNISNTVKDTDAAIQTAKTQYGNNQSALKDTLQNYANDYDTTQRQLEADARKQYNTDYTTGKSGLGAAIAYEPYRQWRSGGSIGNRDPNSDVYGAQARNAYSDNMTWQQLQNEKDGYDLSLAVPYFRNFGTVGHSGVADRLEGNSGAIQNFYTQQDQKYANTADSEKRNWNTIMDILNNANRKDQGFAVRG